jgi:hypothetical protein
MSFGCLQRFSRRSTTATHFEVVVLRSNALEQGHSNLKRCSCSQNSDGMDRANPGRALIKPCVKAGRFPRLAPHENGVLRRPSRGPEDFMGLGNLFERISSTQVGAHIGVHQLHDALEAPLRIWQMGTS